MRGMEKRNGIVAPEDAGCGRRAVSRHPATPLAVSIADVRAAGGSVLEGVSPVDALATYLDARRRLEVIELPEACGMVHLSQSQMYIYVRRGDIPHLRLGRKILFIRGQLEAWLLAKCRGAVWNGEAGRYERLRMGEAV